MYDLHVHMYSHFKCHFVTCSNTNYATKYKRIAKLLMLFYLTCEEETNKNEEKMSPTEFSFSKL